jgi:hypothetical protein
MYGVTKFIIYVHLTFYTVMATASIAIDTTVLATDAHVSSSLEDEEVILNLSSGTYYGLNAVGQRVWMLIQNPQTVGEICDELGEEFDVTRDRVESDVVTLLEEMHAEGLIRIEANAKNNHL